jgi:hypothetical protein
MADDGDTLVGSSYCCVVILYELHDAVLSDCKIIMFHHLSLKTDVRMCNTVSDSDRSFIASLQKDKNINCVFMEVNNKFRCYRKKK